MFKYWPLDFESYNKHTFFIVKWFVAKKSVFLSKLNCHSSGASGETRRLAAKNGRKETGCTKRQMRFFRFFGPVRALVVGWFWLCARSGGAGFGRSLGFFLGWFVGGRGAGFSGIVGCVPAGPLQVKTGVGHELANSTGAVVTTGKGFVRKLLYNFLDPATLTAFIFINGHLRWSSARRNEVWYSLTV